jgi:hypothetical protein
MSDNHEQWLKKQGAKVVGQITQRRASIPTYRDFTRGDETINWAPMETTTEQVYQVEIDERTVERLRRNESLLQNAIDHASKLTRQGLLNSNSVGQYFIDNSHRHHELLKENSMYREAWREFQSIRVLLGETPHWP